MWESVFNPDNLFFRILAKGVDFVGLSLLWVLCCMPIVTIGPATAALYYTVVKTFRHKYDGAFGIYVKQFWRNLKKWGFRLPSSAFQPYCFWRGATM